LAISGKKGISGSTATNRARQEHGPCEQQGPLIPNPKPRTSPRGQGRRETLTYQTPSWCLGGVQGHSATLLSRPGEYRPRAKHAPHPHTHTLLRKASTWQATRTLVYGCRYYVPHGHMYTVQKRATTHTGSVQCIWQPSEKNLII
jgi:hypothetical protein